VTRGEEFKGRAKESAGRMSGNRRLEREGKADRMSASLKRGIDRVRDALTGRGRRTRTRRRSEGF
jgi:uncharacterized protein YjbJ (UPF0337 family)